jgi:hypothetical protein
MHSIISNYYYFCPEEKYERGDAIFDTVHRINKDLPLVDPIAFETAVRYSLRDLATYLDCTFPEAIRFQRSVTREIDATRREAFDSAKIQRIHDATLNAYNQMTNELKSYGKPPHPYDIGKRIHTLEADLMKAKTILSKSQELLNNA